jgi:hypothetical protein
LPSQQFEAFKAIVRFGPRESAKGIDRGSS